MPFFPLSGLSLLHLFTPLQVPELSLYTTPPHRLSPYALRPPGLLKTYYKEQQTETSPEGPHNLFLILQSKEAWVALAPSECSEMLWGVRRKHLSWL